MAGITASTELAVMHIITGMACVTIGGCAFVGPILMAFLAGNIDMFPGQFEGCQVVIEQGRFPAHRGMTGRATCSETPGMRIIHSVTGKTITGCAFEDFILMTIIAGDTSMFALQFEHCQVVIKGGRYPTSGVVAACAVCSQAAIVGIIYRMAREAIAGYASEGTFCVAIFAGSSRMFAFQFEGCQIVIELSGCPAIGGVTGCAICSQLALVGIIFSVAGGAINGCRLQVRDGAGRDVAFGAIHISVFPNQWEWKDVVVEIIPICIDSIMASQAIVPECLQVCDSKFDI